jgi:hypothetical protein
MRFKDIEITIKASPDKEDEALLNQLIGAKGAQISTDTQNSQSTGPEDNPGKVASDDANDAPVIYPLQQEIEMKKAEQGKDSETIANVTKDQEDKGPVVKEEPPLVTQPELSTNQQPGVPASMKKSKIKQENRSVSNVMRGITLSGK